MEPLPHHYSVRASSKPAGSVELTAPGIPALSSSAPREFGGPGNEWSPETLLCAAVADCFVLTFRAVAQASKLAWDGLDVQVEGTLDRAEGGMRFTALAIRVRLAVPPGTPAERAQRLLEKAEKGCLVTRSLAVAPSLVAEVVGA
jgi:organic hydroperoxide reductase OsmC/OhrA